jgi:hypothetical protein
MCKVCHIIGLKVNEFRHIKLHTGEILIFSVLVSLPFSCYCPGVLFRAGSRLFFGAGGISLGSIASVTLLSTLSA